MATVEERLREFGLTLPEATGPPPGVRISMRMARRSGNLLYLSGNGPLRDTLVLGAARAGTGSGPAADLAFVAGDEVAHFVLALQTQGGQGPVFDGATAFKAFIQSASGRTPGGIAVGRLEAQ